MRKLTLVGSVSLCALFLWGGAAHAQQIDAAFGLSGLTAPSASSATGNHFPQTLSGGVYPSFSGDFLFFKDQIGINGEVAWRASRNLYDGFQPFRPFFYDFNGIWSPRFSKTVRGELMAGIGLENIRFYQNFVTCSFTGCTNFVSSHHFLGHFGAGIRFYVFGHLFVRPEAHLYLIRHNVEFSSDRATRFGISIGYTLGAQ